MYAGEVEPLICSLKSDPFDPDNRDCSMKKWIGKILVGLIINERIFYKLNCRVLYVADITGLKDMTLGEVEYLYFAGFS